MLQRTADAKAASSDLPDSQPAESGGVRAGLTLTTRLAVAMIVLVAGAVFAVGWLSYRSLGQALIPRVLERIETHSRFMAADLESHVRSAPGDITTFANLAAVAGLVRARLNGGIDPVDQTTEAAWRQRLQGRLAAQMALKPARSLRFIGIEDGHREIVRVDRPGLLAYRVDLGQRVSRGQPIADLIALDGPEAFIGRTPLLAGTDGFVLSRPLRKYVARGEAIAKIVGTTPLPQRRGYLLED